MMFEFNQQLENIYDAAANIAGYGEIVKTTRPSKLTFKSEAVQRIVSHLISRASELVNASQGVALINQRETVEFSDVERAIKEVNERATLPEQWS